MAGSIISKITDADLKEFLVNCSKYVPMDNEAIFNLTKNFIKRHRGITGLEADIKPLLDLEDRWYNSLEEDNPDFSVYSDPNYFTEVWLCWVNYSRRYLKEITSERSYFGKSIVSVMSDVNRVVDLGCGFGYTTVGLKEIFPKAEVYGTNVPDTPQYQMAQDLAKVYDLKIVDNAPAQATDLLFASEYFEHFQRPVDHLLQVLDTCNPRYMLVANSFSGKAIGHFNYYKVDGYPLTGKETSRVFNRTLVNRGYVKVNTGCWNSRPNFWVHSDYVSAITG